jgi:YidC/Oxa1 family membrane protein insertase
MDQKRLFAAIALSIGILLLFDVYKRMMAPPEAPAPITQQVPAPAVPAPAASGAPVPATPILTAPSQQEAAPVTRAPAQRIAIESASVAGNLNLRGARLDDLVLLRHRETTDAGSPPVRLFAPRDSAAPYFAQWGWTAADGRTKVPDGDTDWQISGGPLAPGKPVSLTWNNGQGQIFEIQLSLDENYMFSAEQRMRNTSADTVAVLPWARIRRESTPKVEGFFILHEGFTGVVGGRLNEVTLADAKTEAQKRRGAAFEQEDAGGWVGITDKYWLAALMPAAPDQPMRAAYRFVSEAPGAAGERWQVDIAAPAAQQIAPGAADGFKSRLFAGAKEVHLLDDYAARFGIKDFDKAIDFGWFYFMTKPFFYALDWLFRVFGNFGVAILVFTLAIKILFFPLASKAYKSMAKMKVLAPKMAELKER